MPNAAFPFQNAWESNPYAYRFGGYVPGRIPGAGLGSYRPFYGSGTWTGTDLTPAGANNGTLLPPNEPAPFSYQFGGFDPSKIQGDYLSLDWPSHPGWNGLNIGQDWAKEHGLFGNSGGSLADATHSGAGPSSNSWSKLFQAAGRYDSFSDWLAADTRNSAGSPTNPNQNWISPSYQGGSGLGGPRNNPVPQPSSNLLGLPHVPSRRDTSGFTGPMAPSSPRGPKFSNTSRPGFPRWGNLARAYSGRYGGMTDVLGDED